LARVILPFQRLRNPFDNPHASRVLVALSMGAHQLAPPHNGTSGATQALTNERRDGVGDV
jgi:hypothetical protein